MSCHLSSSFLGMIINRTINSSRLWSGSAEILEGLVLRPSPQHPTPITAGNMQRKAEHTGHRDIYTQGGIGPWSFGALLALKPGQLVYLLALLS